MLENMELQGHEPKALVNKPEIPEYLVFFVSSFYSLSERRSYGFSAPNPISMSDIKSYMDLYPSHDNDLFLHIMTEMDDEYIKIKTEKRQSGG